MHIIISILKIAGISALVIVLLLIFLLILFLVIPFRYRLSICVPEGSLKDTFLDRKNVKAKATVQFLAFLLMASLEYTEEKPKGVLRILGIPVKRIGGDKKPSKGQRKEKLKKEQKEKQVEQGKTEQEEPKEQTKQAKENTDIKEQDKEEQDKEEQTGGNKTDDFFEGERIHKGSRLRQRILGIADFWKSICSTREKIMDILRDEHIWNGISVLWKQGRRGLRHILPSRIWIRLHFGCPDPAVTGLILGIFSIVYAFYGDTIKIKPDFEQPAFDGEAECRGHLQLLFLLRIAWLLYRDKEVRYVLQRKEIIERK